MIYFNPELTKPILKNLGVDFGPFDNKTMRAGAFIFNESEDKVFLEFGAKAPGTNGTKILPTFEYLVAKNCNVYAICDGYIDSVKYQSDTQDYEIVIKTSPLSPWLVVQDHVLNLTISVGQKIVAGTILGKPGTGIGQLGRTEIQVYLETTNTNYAPFLLFDPSLREEYEQNVWNLMSDWENFKNDTTIYDQEAMIYAGCLYTTLIETDI